MTVRLGLLGGGRVPSGLLCWLVASCAFSSFGGLLPLCSFAGLLALLGLSGIGSFPQFQFETSKRVACFSFSFLVSSVFGIFSLAWQAV